MDCWLYFSIDSNMIDACQILRIYKKLYTFISHSDMFFAPQNPFIHDLIELHFVYDWKNQNQF